MTIFRVEFIAPCIHPMVTSYNSNNYFCTNNITAVYWVIFNFTVFTDLLTTLKFDPREKRFVPF